MYWPRDHNTVIQKVLRKARHGTRIIYVPGNHDENVRDYNNYVFGDILIKNTNVHVTREGRQLLVVHGDEYDSIAQYHQWIASLGSVGYDFLLWINRILRPIRRLLGIHSNFSLAAFVKFKVKNVVQFISDYEKSIVATLLDKGLGRRDLRPYSPCRNQGNGGIFIRQYRGLLRKLHRHRRTFQR